MHDPGDNVVGGLYGFTDAAQTHLELLMNQYVSAISSALSADESSGSFNLTAANELRDHLLRSVELAAVAIQMDGQAASDLVDTWTRLYIRR